MRLICPWEDRNRRFSWLKASGFALVLAPGVRMLWQFAAGDYGILPIAYGGLVYWTGVWATVVLLLALAVTPALKILRWPALIDVRRMIGVAALAYTIFHIIIYFGLRSWRFGFIANESVTRLTLVIAWLSTFGLIVLGATSLDDAIKYMGAKNWQRLHNWNYLISGLAILHIMLARGTYPEQYLLTGLFVWLMTWRVLDRYGRGTDVVALTLLAVGLCLFTAFLEAGHFWLIRRYEANLIAPLLLMTPIFTIGFGVALLGDRLDLRMIAGAAVTLAGVLIIALRPNRVMPKAILLRERT